MYDRSCPDQLRRAVSSIESFVEVLKRQYAEHHGELRPLECEAELRSIGTFHRSVMFDVAVAPK